jgi:hypothetical protein
MRKSVPGQIESHSRNVEYHFDLFPVRHVLEGAQRQERQPDLVEPDPAVVCRQRLTFFVGISEDQQSAAIVVLVRFAHVGILQEWI